MNFIFILFVLLILLYLAKNSNLKKSIKNKEIIGEIKKNKNSLNVDSENGIVNNEVKCDDLLSKSKKHIENINNLKNNFNDVFFPYKYTKEKSIKVEKYIKEYFEEEKALISLIKEYNITKNNEIPYPLIFDINEFFIYNMAQCYYFQDKFKEAQEIFEYGFDNIYLFDLSHNLVNSYEDFIKRLISKKELNFFFYSIDKISSKIKLDNDFIENISYEIGKSLEIKNFFLLFIEALKNANQNNGIIKTIIRKSEIQLKIFKNLDYSDANFKGKNYEKALEYFEIAVTNSSKFNEDISYMYELYGDILYKLKKFYNAIEAYQYYSKSCEENHRVLSKIGDSYKMIKQNETAFYYYIFSLKNNPDYKTSQTKLMSISKKINKNINLEEIIKFLKNNPNITFENIKEIF